jgi:hypothetical protein
MAIERYMTDKDRQEKILRKKELNFKRSIFGLKNLFTKIWNGTSVIRSYDGLVVKLQESGLAYSSKEAKRKLNEYLSGTVIKMVGPHDPWMRFKRVSRFNGSRKDGIRVSYDELDV